MYGKRAICKKKANKIKTSTYKQSYKYNIHMQSPIVIYSGVRSFNKNEYNAQKNEAVLSDAATFLLGVQTSLKEKKAYTPD